MSNNDTSSALTQFESVGRVQQAIRSEARRCADEGSSLAVLAIERDRTGSLVPAGSVESAEEIAESIMRAAKVHCGRDGDHVFRISGERIIAICPKTLPDGARHVASRIREAAADLPPHPDGSRITLSIGISIIAPGSEDAADDLLARAERSLEAAQQSGGDRVLGAAAATPPPPATSLRTLVRSILPTKQPDSERRQGD